MKKTGYNVFRYVIFTLHPLHPLLIPDIILSILFAHLYGLYFAALNS